MGVVTLMFSLIIRQGINDHSFPLKSVVTMKVFRV